MLISFWMMLQFVGMMLSVTLGAHLPQSPASVLLVLIIGALLLAPLAPSIAQALTRVFALVPHAPPVVPRAQTHRVWRVAGDPGTRGTVQARAPSRVVHASA